MMELEPNRFGIWRSALSAMTDTESKLTTFREAAQDIAGQVIDGDIDKATGVDELVSEAELYGIVDEIGREWVERTIGEAFEKTHKQTTKPTTNGTALVPRLQILSKADFIKGFIPPDYLIDGILQRRFIYALTGQTGHAKTAVALLLAQLVSSSDQNAMLGKHRVDKGRVIYFVGENPDDVRMRVIGTDSQRTDDPTQDNISFIPGVFNIEQMMAVIDADLQRTGEASMIIVDTSAAYFLGADEISNTQIGAYARMLRGLTRLPGGPCVLVLCHPIKHATDPSQLLPRGGGAYLAEMDGNLTLWRLGDNLVELDHGKMRGPGFPALTFRLDTIQTPKLMDKRGRMITTIKATVIGQDEEAQNKDNARDEEDRILAAMLAREKPGSFTELATDLKWTDNAGDPYKKKVERVINRMFASTPKMVIKNRDRWTLTEKGKEVAREAALRFKRDDDARLAKKAQGNLL